MPGRWTGSACSAMRPAIGCAHWGRSEHLSFVRNALGVKDKVIAPIWWICVLRGEESLSQPSNYTCPVQGSHVVPGFVELLAEVVGRGPLPITRGVGEGRRSGPTHLGMGRKHGLSVSLPDRHGPSICTPEPLTSRKEPPAQHGPSLICTPEPSTLQKSPRPDLQHPSVCSRGSPQRACSPGQEAPRRCSRFVHQESPVLPGAAISMSQPMHTVLFVAHWVILCGLLCRRRGSVVVGDDGLQTQGSLEGLRIFWKN